VVSHFPHSPELSLGTTLFAHALKAPQPSLELPLALAAGLLSARLVLAAERSPAIAWIMLSPLAIAAYWLSTPAVAAVAGVTGIAVSAVGLYGRFAGVLRGHRHFLAAVSSGTGLLWAIGFSAAASIWRSRAPSLGLVLVPLTTIVVLLPLRLLGAPRFLANPLARTQERWLPIVHTAALGGDLVVAALLAMTSALVAALLVGWPLTQTTALAVAGAASAVVLATTYGYCRFLRAARKVAVSKTLRVAAVAVDAERVSSLNADAGAIEPGLAATITI